MFERIVLASVSLFVTTGALGASTEKIDAVLDLVPPDAAVVVVVPDCGQLSRHLARLNEAAGLGVVKLADALGEFRQRSGIIKGFNDGGAAVVVLDDPLATAGRKRGLTLLPVADYPAFLANFQANDQESVTRLAMLDQREPFAKWVPSVKGAADAAVDSQVSEGTKDNGPAAAPGHVVLGAEERAVSTYERPMASSTWRGRLGESGLACLRRCDIALVLDLKKLAPTWRGRVEQALASGAAGDAPSDGSLSGVQEIARDSALALLRDGRCAVVALDADGLGLGITGAVTFKPGSALAKTFRGGGLAAPALLERLPEAEYLVAGAINAAGLSLPDLADALSERAPAMVSGVFQQMFAEQMALMRLVHGQALGLGAGGGGGDRVGDGPAFTVSTVMEVSDSRSYVKAFEAYLESLNGQSIGMLPGVQATARCTYRGNEQMVGRVSVDRFETVYAYPEGVELPEFLESLGFSGSAGYLAAVGRRHVVQTNTTDATVVNRLIAAAPAADDSEPGLGQAGLIAALRRAGLGPESALEVYLDVSGIAQEAARWIEAITGQAFFQPPAESLSSVALWAHAANNGLSTRVYVPAAAIRWVSHTFAPTESDGRRQDFRQF